MSKRIILMTFGILFLMVVGAQFVSIHANLSIAEKNDTNES